LLDGESAAEIEWLRQNVVTLDSLTSDRMAFFVFVQRYPFKVESNNTESLPYSGPKDIELNSVIARDFSVIAEPSLGTIV
jgi:hypothetical protein